MSTASASKVQGDYSPKYDLRKICSDFVGWGWSEDYRSAKSEFACRHMQKAGFFIQCHPENCNAYSSRMWWDFLATVLVAKSLKNEEDVKLWKLALHKLRFLNPGICIQGLTDDQEAVHKLRELVERFILLNNQLNDKYVKLPEDIHAILHSLNTMTPWFMKKSGLGLTEPPNDELWHSVVHMELANNKLSELPLSPNCPELKVLLLQGNADLTRIPNMFFFKMPLLCILDLSYTSVRELPDSLFELEQLIALYMKGCKCFMKLSPKIGKLKKLEKLDLDGTQITHMPKEMQELTNLQSLFICFYEYRGKKNKRYTQSTIIPSEVISKLKGLNHLSIDVNPDDEQWYENVRDILPEILGLGHLLTLSLYIPHLELLKFIPDSVFEVDFRFIVGRHMQRIISSTPSTCEAKFKESGCSLKFVNGDGVPYEIKRLVGHSKALFLDRHKTIQNLSEFKMMNLEQLRVFILAECREMQTVVDARQSNSGDDTFSHLLYLHVSHMRSLRSIWEGPTPPRSFFGLNLEKMAIYDCPKLQSLSKKELSSQNLKLIKGETKWCDTLQWSKEEWGISCRPSKFDCIFSLIDNQIDIMTQFGIDDDIDDGADKRPLLPLFEHPKQNADRISGITFSMSKRISEGEETLDDGYKWRTCGRKEILGSKNESDFNCDKGGCSAEKRLQKSEEDPTLVEITYKGCHTCTQASSVTNSSMKNQVDIMTQYGIDDDDIDNGPVIMRLGDSTSNHVTMARDKTPLQPLFEHPKQNTDRLSRMTFQVSKRISEGENTLDEWYNSGGDGRKMRDLCSQRGSSSSMEPSCQVDSCETDLSEAKGYHRRHKVCEFHTKASSVLISGLQHRFCQQCSRFHELAEFDDARRSCRRRLAAHNTRRLIPSQWTKKPESFDEYCWDIPGAKFPREYLRCTPRKYQDYLPTIQLQRDGEEPSLNSIAHRGHHTCTQGSCLTDSSKNNQVELMTQFGVDDDDTCYHPALQPSSMRIVEE
ncbi:uncharacterized protein LOC129285669 [Prosopis cineraria]|uniref:uncharacterized protein LOC129285669 n=1 Tax=Prosopis cineraria TaxID=364024 RepID=UPI00240F1E3F|nr:uncharacterized protein LOC129285669 [Prosopis cineraria]